MQKVKKKKISNIASSVKELINIVKADVEEKKQRLGQITEEEKKLAHERKKAKEAPAKMELHQGKVRHAEERMKAKQPQYLHGYGYDHRTAATPMAETTRPTYNIAGHPPTSWP
ncbi:hypothetical protein CRYUN_Cryun13aG0147200 [Craigia yunnanensis]